MLNFRKVAAESDGAQIRAYLTQDEPDPTSLEVHGVSADGRDLETGEKLTAYYTGRGERASWRPDMPRSVTAALGLKDVGREPKNAELDPLFEARRADNGAAWSAHARKNSGFDFVFAPHKSVSLAAEFAPTLAERALIRNAIHLANDETLRYAAQDLGVARKGHAGEKGADRGELGWVTFAHDAARPTLAVQNGPEGGTYLIDAPIAGDPHYHLHNFIPNLVVTDDGRVGSIDARALSQHKVHEYGAYFQAQLAERLRALGIRTDLDADEQAVVVSDIPEAAVALFSKRDRQVIGDAKRVAKENDLDWDELSIERKKMLLHEASAAGRLGKTKDEAHEVWRAQAAGIGWSHDSVLVRAPSPARTANERRESAYAFATAALSRDFQTAGVVDQERLRVHAARGLIAAGIAGGRDDVDGAVALIEQRGFRHNGVAVLLITGTLDGKERVSHSEQLRIEQTVSESARRAAQDRSGALPDGAIGAAIAAVEQSDAGVRFTREQSAAIAEGDYDQVVRQIADLYIERDDALKAQDPRLGVTITTLTNAEAADISQAIRQRLKARGAIGADEALYKAVVYRGDKPELFDLPIAAGDRLRLYRKTVANIDGRRGSIGNNGDIVEVVGKTASGLILRNDRGQTAQIDWKKLSDKKTGRLLLGFGRAFTIDAAQGMSTRGEHINALPHGTGATTAFKTYTAESRATGRTHTVIAKAAVYGAVQRTQALGDKTPIMEEDLWARVARDASAKPYKALAVDLVGKARRGHEHAVGEGLGAHQRLEAASSAAQRVGAAMRAAFEAGAARQAFARQREAIEEIVEACRERLDAAAEFVADHLRAVMAATRPDADVGAPSPSAAPPAAKPGSPSPGS